MISDSGAPTAKARSTVNARTVRAHAGAAAIAPIIAEIEAAGVTLMYGIKRVLNELGVPAASGRATMVRQVRRVMDRLKWDRYAVAG